MEYLILKWIHIISATLLYGTGLGSAYYKFMSDRSGNVTAIAIVNRHVVLADWMFTTPTIILQPLTGLGLVYLSGHSLSTPWVGLSIGLYGVAGLCWLPVVYLQIRMKNLSHHSQNHSTDLPEKYWSFARLWFWLGIPAFISITIVFALMVLKPW